MAMVEERRLYKHLKTGKFYWVLNDHMILESTLEICVAYTNVMPYTEIEIRNSEPIDTEYMVWIRPYDEFYDGRFKIVKLKEK